MFEFVSKHNNEVCLIDLLVTKDRLIHANNQINLFLFI